MLDVRKVLFPTDFSHCSTQALAHALMLAKGFGAEIHMLHAVVLHEEDPANPGHRFPEPVELLRRMFEAADAEMARLADLPEDRGIRVVQQKRRGFSAANVILEYADEIDADVIVMGTHGHRGAGRLFLGSVAEQVVRYSRCPVLTLRETKKDRELEKIERIVVPVDFSEHSGGAVSLGKELASRLGARLQLLHVVEVRTLPAFYGPFAVVDVTEKLREHSMKALDELATTAPGPTGVEIELHVAEGVTAEAIVEFAADFSSDLILIPSHGLTGIERILLGSTAARVARIATVPVMTIKPFGKALGIHEAA